MAFMQSAHGWDEAKAFAIRARISARIVAGSASFRNGGAYLHLEFQAEIQVACDADFSPPRIGGLGCLAVLNIQFFKRP